MQRILRLLLVLREEWCFILPNKCIQKRCLGCPGALVRIVLKQSLKPCYALRFCAEDPVGDFGEGVRKAYTRYVSNTKCIVDIKLYYSRQT